MKVKTIVLVSLPEPNEGKGPSVGALCIESDDVEAVRRALVGKGLGVQGTELGAHDFHVVRLLSLEDVEGLEEFALRAEAWKSILHQ